MRVTGPLMLDAPYSIRPAVPADAAKALALFYEVRTQSPYLLLEATEGILDVAAQERQFLAMQAERKQALFLALHLHQPVGFVGLTRGGFKRNQHVATLAIAVAAAHQRRGLGASLIDTAVGWARREGVRRLELSVATENVSAVRLYEARKFRVEGVKRMSFLIGDRYVDECLMALVLENSDRHHRA